MIYTSYFAAQKNNTNVVAICRGVPKWFNGEIYQDLAPSWDILNEWKKSDKTLLDQQRYTMRYYDEVLSKLDPAKVYEDLDNKILLCYEKSSDFCHRHIVANWLKENGFFAQELE